MATSVLTAASLQQLKAIEPPIALTMERGLQRSPQADEDFVAAFVKDAPCAGVAVRCHAYPDRLRSLPNGAEILKTNDIRLIRTIHRWFGSQLSGWCRRAR